MMKRRAMSRCAKSPFSRAARVQRTVFAVIALCVGTLGCRPRPHGPWTRAELDPERSSPGLEFRASTCPAPCSLHVEIAPTDRSKPAIWQLELADASASHRTSTQLWWIDQSGTVYPAARCASTSPGKSSCERIAAPKNPRLELLVVDVYATDAELIRERDAILDTLASSPDLAAPSVPRWLISNRPIESAGVHGLGTRSGDATYFHAPLELQTLIRAGAFDGVITSSADGHEFTRDLGDALIRSARIWLPRPLFQAVVGELRTTLLERTTRSSIAYQPEFWSRQAEIHLSIRGWEKPSDRLEISFTQSNGPTAVFEVPRIAPMHSMQRPRAHVEPCLGCRARREDEHHR